jgi:hypothetical protein
VCILDYKKTIKKCVGFFYCLNNFCKKVQVDFVQKLFFCLIGEGSGKEGEAEEVEDNTSVDRVLVDKVGIGSAQTNGARSYDWRKRKMGRNKTAQ